MATNAKRWMAALVTSLAAAQAGAQSADLEALERAFWRCDHAATQGLLDGGAAMECSVATEAFKTRRFGGDFAAMLAWWRVHKDTQHQALAVAASQRLTRGASHTP